MRDTQTLSPRVRILGASLREARQAARFGLRELARRLDVNPSILAHWEHGTRTPDSEEVSRVLGALGVRRDQARHILNLARGLSDPNSITFGSKAALGHHLAETAHEAVATAMTIWSPLLIPSLLQIPDYLRATVKAALPTVAARESYLTEFLERRASSPAGTRVPVDVFVGAAALQETVDNDDTMVRQLRFLGDTAAINAAVTIRLVPSDVGFHPGLAGAFTLFTMPEGDPIVRCDAYDTSVFLVDKRGLYRSAAENLDARALSHEDSVAALEACVAERESRVQQRISEVSSNAEDELWAQLMTR
ncbi:Scr1 family TA system antitoxin-like transcriptional regulator [Amycolatopsis sp. NPDC005232]|uniref:helix-turn-helix domain-containing protein n=1 Tax=Amycolatopsis sp. NPDC005232 TaxID=3157027 RepID=UPI00339E8EC6